MKKTGPYVGVTGFMTLSELVQCDNAFCEAVNARKSVVVVEELKFMAGILVSSKTLAGATNKWPNRYPPVGQVAEITSLKRRNILHTIHYNTDDAATIDEQVDEVMKLAPGGTDAIQLNIRWANPVRLQRVKRKYPDLRIILQVGTGALSDVDETADIFTGEALRAYEGVIDDYLIDPSGGVGKDIDIWRAFACMADDDIPASINPGVAGGRDATNVHHFKGLMRRLKRPVNIDAEGRLRTPKNDVDGGDHLHIDAAGVDLLADAMRWS